MKKRMLALVIVMMLVLAGAQMTGCRRIKSPVGPSAAEAKDMKVVVVLKGAYLGLDKQLEVGETVRQKETGNLVGTIESVETSPTQSTVSNSEGVIVLSTVPNQEDIYVTIKGSAVPREDGYRFDGQALYVNAEADLVTPFVQFKGIVLSMEETGR